MIAIPIITRSLTLARPVLCGLCIPVASALAVDCRPMTHQNVPYTLCVVDLTQDALEIFHLDAQAKPFMRFEAVQAHLQKQQRELIFAVNAGMFESNLSPVGLLISDGTSLKSLNLRGWPGQPHPADSSTGNFYLQPNGVFWVQAGKAQVADTMSYLRAAPKPRLAVQSGPLLLQHGKLPEGLGAFNKADFTRNGVCALSPSKVAFLNSDKPTSIKQLALAMRDALKCQSALYLDGCRTALFSKALGRNDSSCPNESHPDGQAMGAMLGVARPLRP